MLNPPPDKQLNQPSPIRIRVAAIIVQQDHLLLVKHRKDGQEYCLLPGGGVKKGESITDALKRELREEAQIEITPGPLVLVNDAIEPNGQRHILNLYFRAEVVHGEPTLGDDPRVVDVAFMPLEKLETITLYPDIRQPLLKTIPDGPPSQGLYLGSSWKF